MKCPSNLEGANNSCNLTERSNQYPKPQYKCQKNPHERIKEASAVNNFVYILKIVEPRTDRKHNIFEKLIFAESEICHGVYTDHTEIILVPIDCSLQGDPIGTKINYVR